MSCFLFGSPYAPECRPYQHIPHCPSQEVFKTTASVHEKNCLFPLLDSQCSKDTNVVSHPRTMNKESDENPL